MPPTGPLRIRRDGAVATLLLDRPEKRNAIALAMWRSLPALVGEACADPEVRVLVVASAVPGMFSAGADIAEFPALRSSVESGRHYSASIRAGQRAVAHAPVPTIAAIAGGCLGGGCGLALSCDLRISDDTSYFGVPAAKLGIVYSLPSTKRLVDAVGPGWARQLLYTGDVIDAPTALRIGLVNELHPPDQLAGRVQALAERVGARSPVTAHGAKVIVERVLDGQFADDDECQALYDESYVAEGYQAAVAGFLARR